MLKVVYVGAFCLWGLCLCVVGYFAIWKAGRGGWGYFLLLSLGFGALARQARIRLKVPNSN